MHSVIQLKNTFHLLIVGPEEQQLRFEFLVCSHILGAIEVYWLGI